MKIAKEAIRCSGVTAKGGRCKRRGWWKKKDSNLRACGHHCYQVFGPSAEYGLVTSWGDPAFRDAYKD